jgi:hypothetical protein
MTTIAVAAHIASTIIAALKTDPTIAQDIQKLTDVIVSIEKLVGPALVKEVQQWIVKEEQQGCFICSSKKK